VSDDRERLFVVCWEIDGILGRGSPLTRELAEAWVRGREELRRLVALATSSMNAGDDRGMDHIRYGTMPILPALEPS
jgi:hypothetical protein